MAKRRVRLLGIVGSPRKNGNTEVMVREALEGCKAVSEVETDIFLLAEKTIKPCISCYKCGERETPCIFMEKDDFKEIWLKYVEADGYIIGSPVYVMSITGQLKILLDRLSQSMWGASQGIHPVPRRLKVGGAICQGASRYGGAELAVDYIIRYFAFSNIIPVTGGIPLFYEGVIGCTHGRHEPGIIVEEDNTAMKLCRILGKMVAEKAKIMRNANNSNMT